MILFRRSPVPTPTTILKRRPRSLACRRRDATGISRIRRLPLSVPAGPAAGRQARATTSSTVEQPSQHRPDRPSTGLERPSRTSQLGYSTVLQAGSRSINFLLGPQPSDACRRLERRPQILLLTTRFWIRSDEIPASTGSLPNGTAGVIVPTVQRRAIWRILQAHAASVPMALR